MVEGNWTSRQSMGGARRKGLDLQGEGTHQSLISCALESSSTLFLHVLRPHWNPRAFHCSSFHCRKERKTCVLFHGTCVFLMCSRDCNVPDGKPKWFVKNGGTSVRDSINDALAVVACSPVLNKNTFAQTQYYIRLTCRNYILVTAVHLKIASLRAVSRNAFKWDTASLRFLVTSFFQKKCPTDTSNIL